MTSTVGDYLALAHAYAARFSRATLWIVFGLPATGKSTLAKALADHFDVARLRSDVIRKQRFGDTAEDSGAIDQGIYSPQATEETYRDLLAQSEAYLKQGSDAVLDATFSRHSHRRLALASQRQATTIFVECRTATALLRERLQQRDRLPGISDARLAHRPHFQRHFEP